jgi:hypothetical protein
MALDSTGSAGNYQGELLLEVPSECGVSVRATEVDCCRVFLGVAHGMPLCCHR